MPTNLKKQTNVLGSSGHEKSMVVNTEVQNGYCVKYSITLKKHINTVCNKSAGKDSLNCFTILTLQHAKVSMSLACIS